MKMKKRNGVKWCSLLLAVLMLVTAFVPATTASAAGNCEEWWTRKGMVDKAGDNENGYTIGSRGDTSFTVCRYEEQFDILATEIQFSFKAWPTDPNLKDSWAYLNFGLDFKDSSYMTTKENNLEAGRIQILIYQREAGGFHMNVYNGTEYAVISMEKFDFDAVHTLSFEEKALGIFVVFDGMPYTNYDFTEMFEKHMGDNAGKTYFAVGGYEGYEFTNLKIVPKEKKEVSPDDYVAPDNSGGKLGDTTVEEPEEDVEETFQMTPAIIAAIAISGVTVIAAVVITVYVIKKKKGNKKIKQDGGVENEKV